MKKRLTGKYCFHPFLTYVGTLFIISHENPVRSGSLPVISRVCFNTEIKKLTLNTLVFSLVCCSFKL